MTEPLIFPIKNVYELAVNGRKMAEPHLKSISDSKGCGSIIDISLMVPESAVLFMSPLACGRHVTVFAWHRCGRVYTLLEEDSDIVNGEYLPMMDVAVGEILSEVRPTPKVVIICATCIDRLMGTDWDGIARDLAYKYHIDIIPVWMEPVKNHNGAPMEKLMEKVFSSIHDSADNRKGSSINVIGKLRPFNEESEIYELLGNAGYGPVRHLIQCDTYQDFQDMALASATIVTSIYGRRAAEKMRQLYGIPYVMADSTCDPEDVHNMYKSLEQLLGIRIDDESYYRAAIARITSLPDAARNKTIAVGESYTLNVNAFKIAVDLSKWGLNVKYVFCNGKIEDKIEDIKWLAENRPNTEVVLMSHPSMVKLIDEPLPVDIAIGTYEDWFFKSPSTHWITMEYIQHDTDYASIIRLADMIEGCLEDEE